MTAHTPIRPAAEVRTIVANCFAMPSLASQHQDQIRKAMLKSMGKLVSKAKGVSPKVVNSRLAQLAMRRDIQAAARAERLITVRGMLARGMTRKEIEAAMGLSRPCISSYVRDIVRQDAEAAA